MKSPPSKSEPDPGVIAGAQRGEKEAMKALLEAVEPWVRQWSLAHTGDPDTASDLTQEVLILLLRKISSYRGEARFSTWLFSVTRNQALERVRRKGRREKKMTRLRTEMESSPQASNPGGARVDRERLSGLVRTFVRELPERQREVFQLSEFQGMSSPEIGSILRLSPGSVRAALLKARRSLRRKILENHPEFVEEFLS